MIEFNEELRDILDKTEWIALVTSSPEAGPHLVAAWGYRFRKIDVQQRGKSSFQRGDTSRQKPI